MLRCLLKSAQMMTLGKTARGEGAPLNFSEMIEKATPDDSFSAAMVRKDDVTTAEATAWNDNVTTVEVTASFLRVRQKLMMTL